MIVLLDNISSNKWKCQRKRKNTISFSHMKDVHLLRGSLLANEPQGYEDKSLIQNIRTPSWTNFLVSVVHGCLKCRVIKFKDSFESFIPINERVMRSSTLLIITHRPELGITSLTSRDRELPSYLHAYQCLI